MAENRKFERRLISSNALNYGEDINWSSILLIYECKGDMIYKDAVMKIVEQEYCYGTISKSINPTMKFALTLQVETLGLTAQRSPQKAIIGITTATGTAIGIAG